jgi:threonine dehydrogenase-like Zn-dependent dehydrogenase
VHLKGGETVVVYGAGPVGLFAMRSAWLVGAGRVIAVDRVDYRLEFARRWARVETLNFEDTDIITTIKGLTDDRGADCSIDAVGCEAAGGPVQRAFGVFGKCRPARRSRSTGASTGRARAARSQSSASTVRPTRRSTSAPR